MFPSCELSYCLANDNSTCSSLSTTTLKLVAFILHEERIASLGDKLVAFLLPLEDQIMKNSLIENAGCARASCLAPDKVPITEEKNV